MRALYGLHLYGVPLYGQDENMPYLTWHIEIDWDNDGVYEENAAGVCRRLEVDRGRDNYLYMDGNGIASGFERVQVGRCSFILDNKDDKYNPYNKGSSLYGNVVPGRFVKVEALWTTSDGTTTYPVFAGVIKDIRPNYGLYGDWTCQISCVDGMQQISDAPATPNAPVYSQLAVSEALANLFDVGGSNPIYPSRWSVNIESTTDAGNLAYFWKAGRPIDVINELTDAQVGMFFVAGDGAATYLKRGSTDTTALTVTSDQIGRDVSFSMPWEVKRDNYKVWSNAYKNVLAQTVYDLDDPLYVEGSTDVTVYVDYAVSGVTCAATSVTASTDYTANTQADGAGADMTASFSIAFTDLGNVAKLIITNSSSDAGWLTSYTLTGTAIIPAQRFYVQDGTGIRQFEMDNRYVWGNASAKAKIQQVRDRVGTDKIFPVVNIRGRNDIQYKPDLFDLVDVTINLAINSSSDPTEYINGVYRVGSIRHVWKYENGQAAETTWRLEPYVTST